MPKTARAIIYRAIFPNGMVYVGESLRTLAVRRQAHYDAAKAFLRGKRYAGTNRRLAEALLKYGDAVKWDVVATAPTDKRKRIKAQDRQIVALNSMWPNGYNFILGGKHHPKTRAEISASHRGKTHTAETCAKISAANARRTHTAKTRAKMSASAMGRIPWNKGKIFPKKGGNSQKEPPPNRNWAGGEHPEIIFSGG